MIQQLDGCSYDGMLKVAVWFADNIQGYDRHDINELCEFAGHDDVIIFLREIHRKYSMDLSSEITYANEYKKEREE